MEQSQQNGPNPFGINFPLLSLIAGICALVACCSPPRQMFCGACAIVLAYLSKQGRPFSKPALIGLIFGCLSVVCSILIFVQYVMALRVMSDPANSELVKEALRQSQEIMNYFQNYSNGVPVN